MKNLSNLLTGGILQQFFLAGKLVPVASNVIYGVEDR